MFPCLRTEAAQIKGLFFAIPNILLEVLIMMHYDAHGHDRDTIERPFGWVFSYNSKKFIETGSIRYLRIGLRPVIVDRHSGAIKFFGTPTSDEEAIQEYERELEGGRGQAQT